MQQAFSKLFKLALSFFALGVALQSHAAIPMAQDQFIPGKHYKKIESRIRAKPEVKQLLAEHPNQVQVIMFFNYGCYWCSQLDRAFDDWVGKQNDPRVDVSKIPVVFSYSWEIYAKIYYAIQTLDSARELDDEIYHAIHQQRINLARLKTLEDFLSQHDVDIPKFRQTLESFGIGRKVKRAEELGLAFDITITPIIIINGPSASYLTSWSMNGSQARLFAVMDHLIKQEAALLKKSEK